MFDRLRRWWFAHVVDHDSFEHVRLTEYQAQRERTAKLEFVHERPDPFGGPVPLSMPDWDAIFPQGEPTPEWCQKDRRPAWVLQAATAQTASCLGGTPWLGEDERWPRVDGDPMAFVGQLDFAELSASARALPAPLPSTGLLRIFLGGGEVATLWLPDSQHATQTAGEPTWPVVYLSAHAGQTDHDTEKLPPNELGSVGGHVHWAQGPPSEHHLHLNSGAYQDDVEVRDALEQAGIDVIKVLEGERMTGVIVQLEEAAIHPATVFQGVGGWMTVCQIPSLESNGMVFHDVGTIYIVAHEDRMRSEGLAQARAIMQSY